MKSNLFNNKFLSPSFTQAYVEATEFAHLTHQTAFPTKIFISIAWTPPREVPINSTPMVLVWVTLIMVALEVWLGIPMGTGVCPTFFLCYQQFDGAVGPDSRSSAWKSCL
ncbi:hypothetical protein P3S68_026753 [Capsicum galapagoense]